LAWTEVGGELLTIEGGHRPRQGQIKTTANLRRLQESIQAVFLVRARPRAEPTRSSLGLLSQGHPRPLPEGAVPKDGPSAGIGMVTGSSRRFPASGAARRGDDRRGHLARRVLPIGGLKEKLLQPCAAASPRC